VGTEAWAYGQEKRKKMSAKVSYVKIYFFCFFFDFFGIPT